MTVADLADHMQPGSDMSQQMNITNAASLNDDELHEKLQLLHDCHGPDHRLQNLDIFGQPLHNVYGQLAQQPTEIGGFASCTLYMTN